MSEQDVITTIGQPTKSTLDMCGGATGHPWQCKTLVYGLAELIVYFRQDAKGTWVVNSWQ
jgi:hypothetical protein